MLKLKNNVSTVLASSISDSDINITLVSGGGAQFPALGVGDYTYATFGEQTNPEVVKVTAINGDVLTVVRGQDGTAATAWSAGALVELRPVAAMFGDLQTEIGTKASASALSAHTSDTNNPHNVTKAKIDLGNVDNTADANKNVLSATKWTTSRTLTIGKTGKSVDGSADVAWTLNEIGVVPTSVEDILVFPEPQGLIRVDWWGDAIPTANVGKQEYTGRSRIVIDGVAWEGKSKFKTQGAGSIGYPKKNLSLKFYDSDDNRLKVKIGDSCVFTDFVFKAEYTDGSKANNYICYKLIEQMTKCRGAFPSHEVDYAWLGDTGNVPTGMPSGAVGYVKIWPCVMYHNDVFYGVGNLIIKEDLANFNIDENNPNHTHFEFDGRGTINGDSQPNWNRLDPALTDQVQLSMSLTQDREDAIMRLNALVTGSQQNFNDNALECFDKRNLVDCYLLLELVFGWDNVVNDLDFVSYDNQIFYIFHYDLDLSLGLSLPSSGNIITVTDPLVNDNTTDPMKTLWVLVRNAWGSEIRSRYGELRSRGVFSVANIAELGKRVIGLFSKELLEMEYVKWPASYYQIHTLAQTVNWIAARITWLDGEMNYVPHDHYVTAVYQGNDPDFPRPDGAAPVYWLAGTKPNDAKEGDFIITEMD